MPETNSRRYPETRSHSSYSYIGSGVPFHGRSSYEERFCGKTSRINCHSSKRSENALYSFLLPKTTKRYSLGKIFAVPSIILRLQKRELNFWDYHFGIINFCHYHLIINLISSYLVVMDKTKRKQISNTQIEIVNKQTYLGIEKKSSGRCAYARQILSKKATKIVLTIKRLLSNIDSSAVETRNELFDALVKPVLLYGCEIWQPELLSYKTHFDKSTIEQVHIKFCKQTLNVPWYTENKACRAEFGRHPL